MRSKLIGLAIAIWIVGNASGMPLGQLRQQVQGQESLSVTLSCPPILERGSVWRKAKVTFTNLGNRPCLFSKHPGVLRLVFSDEKGKPVERLNFDGNIDWRRENQTDLVLVKPKGSVELTLGVLPESHAMVKPGNYKVAVQCMPISKSLRPQSGKSAGKVLAFPTKRFVSSWTPVVVTAGFISTHSPNDEFYRSLMTLPVSSKGLSMELVPSDPNRAQSRFSATMVLTNESDKPITIDNRLGHMTNVHLYFFDASNRLVTYKYWSHRMSQISPQHQNDLTVLAPKELYKAKDLFKEIQPVAAGTYTVVSTYSAPHGVGETPFEGQYWMGQIRTHPVKFVITGA